MKTKTLDKTHPFFEKAFVLSGSLENYTREEASKIILENGGKVSSSISKNTDFLLLGENPGSKLKKAQNLKVKILTEKKFMEMI